MGHFVGTGLKSQMLGSLCQGMLRDVGRMGSYNASTKQGKGSLFAWGEEVETEKVDVKTEQGRL